MKNKRIYKWLKGLGIALSLLLMVLLVLAHRVEFRSSDDDLTVEFNSLAIHSEIKRYRIDRRTIRYVEFGKKELPVTILVHGAPSSLSFFKSIYTDTTVLNHTRLVGVDRPGYGYSDFGKPVTSITDQARLLQPLLNYYTRNGSRVVLAASSYGGPIVAKLAMDNPEKVSGILFVSSSLAPGEEYTYPISYLIDHKWIKWMFPTLLQVANDEKLHHRKALAEIQDGWNNIRSRIIVLHGKADQLVYFSNALYARDHLINARTFKLIPLEGIGHSIFWDRPELVKKSILELVKGDL